MATNGNGNWARKWRLLFNLAFVSLLFSCMFNRQNFSSPLYLRKLSSKSSYRWSSQASGPKFVLRSSVFDSASPSVSAIPGGNYSEMLGIRAENPSEGDQNLAVTALGGRKNATPCNGLKHHINYDSECEFIKAHKQCSSGGLIEYIKFFYCTCEKWPIFGYAVLGVWLIGLFYMLGNTAADYFCRCLEKLSDLLNLPPTVAGVTLLPLGNGAPDVFASIAAFVGADAGQVGLNSILGGAVFVTCVVAGTVSLLAANSGVTIDRKCFIRDICFFLFGLASLCVILIAGQINLLGALAFISIYFMYALSVVASEFFRRQAGKLKLHSIAPLLPVQSRIFAPGVAEEDNSIYSPLLDPVSSSGLAVDPAGLQASLPQWMWGSNVALYSDQTVPKIAESPRPLWGWSDEREENKISRSCIIGRLLFLFELPLILPRRLTIPIIEADRWSRGFAIASAMLAPLLLAVLWNTQDDKPLGIGKEAYIVGGILGAILGTLAFCTTEAEKPPQRFLFPWVAGGFFMCIVWFYIVANELLALLVSFGVILDINASILGLTVLAWGNSMGDLMSNGALAMHGGNGVQIALSGCYAGPMFNTVAGLGLSLVLGSWSMQPTPFTIPTDTSLFGTLGFLVAALLWALVILPNSGMRPNKLFGIGLLTLYLSFLAFRLGKFLEFVSFCGLS